MLRVDALHRKIGKKFKPPKVKTPRLTENRIKRLKAKYDLTDAQVKSKFKELLVLKKANTKVKLKKTSKKMRRVQKLMDNWEPLEKKMQQQISHGVSNKGMSLTSRLAYGLLVMMRTGIRTGNEKSSEGYVCNNKHIKEFGKIIKTYGLTTLLVGHTETNSKQIFLNFTGKKGVSNILDTNDPVLRKYYDVLVRGKSSNDRLLDITYKELKHFVKHAIGRKFTPKDVRTTAVNFKFIEYVRHLKERGLRPVEKKGEAKRIVKSIIEHTAEEIGHTPGVCKGAYLSPTLVLHVEEMLYKPREKSEHTERQSRKGKDKEKRPVVYRPV